MKTRTRVVAWFYILLQLPAMLVVTVLMVAGGSIAGRAHALDEWIDVAPEASVKGMVTGLATLLAVVGVD